MSHGREIISLVAQRQDLEQFRKKNWIGTFEEYLDLVRQKPEVTRNAFERVYDMIMSAGTTVYEESRGDAGGSTTSSSTTRTTTAATPCSASMSRWSTWSTPSRAPPRATASRSACCCCTARSAAARARSPAC